MFSCPTRATREVTEGTTSRPLRVVFVCLGNICRSPIAERVAEHAAAEAGITGVEFSSAGTISEKYDDPMDHRAVAVLRERGYRYADHKARRITEARIESADLVVAMEDVHLRSVLKLAPDPSRVCLLTEFDPTAVPGSGVPDPWFGSDAGFYDTLTAIEAAMPGSAGPHPQAPKLGVTPTPLTGLSSPRCDARRNGTTRGRELRNETTYAAADSCGHNPVCRLHERDHAFGHELQALRHWNPALRLLLRHLNPRFPSAQSRSISIRQISPPISRTRTGR